MEDDAPAAASGDLTGLGSDVKVLDTFPQAVALVDSGAAKLAAAVTDVVTAQVSGE